MTPSKHFQHLQPEDRLTIASLWQQRQRVGQSARVLGRSPGTISRELRRNAAPDDRSQRVSHETFYNTIYAHARDELRSELIGLLRHAHS